MPDGLEENPLRLENGGVVIGSGEGDGFLPVDKVSEFARILGPSAAFSVTPSSRSTF